MTAILRYKGRFRTKKQYERHIKQIEGGKQRKKNVCQDNETNSVIEGRRIVEFDVIAKHLYCTFCKESLLLDDIEKENKRGLTSVLSIRCRKCCYLTSVPTGKHHLGPSGSIHHHLYDCNTKATLGALHSGLGFTAVNKFFNVMNIPFMSSNTFKNYEREIGPVIEAVAEKSCEDACAEERLKTLSNLDEMNKRLPENTEDKFLTPDRLNTPSEYFSDQNNNNENNNEKVRVIGSYDMGWCTRSSGRQYDSLSGFGHIIGSESGKVMGYTTLNRKCRLCDKGHLKNDHDCRKNFYGSAKAMEPNAAVQLVCKNSILKDKNMEIGVFVGDNDSSSICAIRKESDHKILKQSDKNHTAKGVKSLLYKIDKQKDPDKEMTPEAIDYIHRCFRYAMAQNRGDSKMMAASIKNVPYHAFNEHDNCGDWCGFKKDKENYKHNTIVGGLKNPILFDELKTIFQKLADNSDTFVSGGSTQANESLNNVLSKKAPKSILYGMSESYDFRAASAVSQKNIGEQYVQNVLEKYNLSPGSNLTKHIERVNKFSKLKANKAKIPSFKLNRQRLRKQRLQLKYQKEAKEGTTYESNIGLFEMPAVPSTNLTNAEKNSDSTSTSLAIVFFDLETGGFSMNDDILQIAMKCGSAEFNKYIDPTKRIQSKASEVHGLTFDSGELRLNGVRVLSSPVKVVFQELLKYLKAIGTKCILVAHNSKFDAPRLLKKIEELSIATEFDNLVSGFSDTLPMFRNKFPERKGKGQLKLTTLATELLNLSCEEAHNAMHDVILLEKLVSANFSYGDLVENIKTIKSLAEAKNKTHRSKELLQTLKPLEEILSKMMLKRIADANISYNLLLESYQRSEQDLVNLLKQKSDGKTQLIKSKKILNNILNHFK